MDESVDAYVPSKAIPQTVLMDVYGGGGRRSQGSREANLSCFELRVDRGDPIGISARLYRFPSRIRRSQMQLVSQPNGQKREVGVGRGDSLERPGLA